MRGFIQLYKPVERSLGFGGPGALHCRVAMYLMAFDAEDVHWKSGVDTGLCQGWRVLVYSSC
jgi:hypothetical protein